MPPHPYVIGLRKADEWASVTTFRDYKHTCSLTELKMITLKNQDERGLKKLNHILTSRAFIS